jgi:transposase InsO family protein
MIKANENQFRIGLMCRLLSVSRSGYYGWKQRPPSGRGRANQLLAAEIKRVFDDEKGRAGAPRVAHRLKAEGVLGGRHRVARIMRDNGLRAKAARKYKATTHSKQSLPVAPNLLEQNFMADKPDQNGFRISRMSGRTKAGCTWRSCWNSIQGGSLAGRLPSAWRQRWCVMPSSWCYGTGRCRRELSSTLTGAANIVRLFTRSFLENIGRFAA